MKLKNIIQKVHVGICKNSLIKRKCKLKLIYKKQLPNSQRKDKTTNVKERRYSFIFGIMDNLFLVLCDKLG